MKILIADDHTLFRDVLVQYLKRAEPKCTIEIAKDFNAAYHIIENDQNFDLVLLDYCMPGMFGLDGIQKIIDTYPSLRVALMSGLAEEDVVEKALDMGVVAYFPKTLSGKALLGAIQLVLTGERYVPLDQKTEKIMPSYYADARLNGHASPSGYGGMESAQAGFEDFLKSKSLTPREKEVLKFIMQGYSNKEIANTLDLQIVTVKLHVRGVCRKLEAKNRTQAAMIAREMGVSDKMWT